MDQTQEYLDKWIQTINITKALVILPSYNCIQKLKISMIENDYPVDDKYILITDSHFVMFAKFFLGDFNTMFIHHECNFNVILSEKQQMVNIICLP